MPLPRILLVACLLPAGAATWAAGGTPQPSPAGGWTIVRDGATLEAVVHAPGGATFGEQCTLSERRCHWLLRAPEPCAPGSEATVMATSQAGATPLVARCAGPAGAAGGWRRDFTDWEPLEKLLEGDGTLTIALPVAHGGLTLLRFPLAGRTQAQATAESAALEAPPDRPARRLLFIGNSFLFGAGTPVQSFRPDSVNDLNGQHASGVPALVKLMLAEGGHPADVDLETWPGVGLDWHLANRREALLAARYDAVVMHGYSTLDQEHPGDDTLLRRSTAELAALLAARSPGVDLRLMETWPRADQVYPVQGHWHGRAPADMERDLASAYARAAAGAPAVRGVIPVGAAFVRAMREGVADDDPYDGLQPGRIDLWGEDHYHASSAGYYLEALVIYGALTREDPRALGPGEAAGAELGLDAGVRTALQGIAARELQARGQLPPD